MQGIYWFLQSGIFKWWVSLLYHVERSKAETARFAHPRRARLDPPAREPTNCAAWPFIQVI
jgi:hypothetical protein